MSNPLNVVDRPNSYIGRSVTRPNAKRLLAGKGKYATLGRHSERLPERSTFFVRQCDKFIQSRVCGPVISAVDMGQCSPEQRNHQRGRVADLARISKSKGGVRSGGVRITKTP